MSTPEEHLRMQWDEVHKADADLATLRRLGVLETDPAYASLWGARGAALAKVGTVLPRDTILLAWSFGFSPGIIKVWHDGDAGWVSEARVRPDAPPVYKKVSDEVAVAIIKKEVTPELEKVLMTPDPYEGE